MAVIPEGTTAACCACVQGAANLLAFAVYGLPGFIVDPNKNERRKMLPADVVPIISRLWGDLRRAAAEFPAVHKQLAACTVPVLAFRHIEATSNHELATGIAFAVLNNARLAAGYRPIFPIGCLPHSAPLLQRALSLRSISEAVDAEGWDRIGDRWKAVSARFRNCFPRFDPARLIGHIRKEAMSVSTQTGLDDDSPKQERPTWSRSTRILTVDGSEIQIATREAPKQFAVLDLLQNANWPANGTDVKCWSGSLKDAVEGLNKKLTSTRLQIQRLDNDTRIGWNLANQ